MVSNPALCLHARISLLDEIASLLAKGLIGAVVALFVAEPPKLNRFKCANYHLNG